MGCACSKNGEKQWIHALFGWEEHLKNRKFGRLHDKGKTSPVQAWTGPQVSSRLQFPEFLDNRHIKMVRLPAQCTGSLYTPGNISGAHFCWSLSRPQGHIAAGKFLWHHRESNPRKMTRWIGNIIMELRRVIVRIGKDGSGPGSYALEVSDLAGTSSGVKSYIRINNSPMEYYVAWTDKQ